MHKLEEHCSSHRAVAAMPFLAAGGQNMAMAAARLNAQALKSVMWYQIEVLGFLKHRYEQNLRLLDDLIESGELNDTFDVFSVFVENAACEYSREAVKIATMGSRFAAETASRVRKEADTRIEDIMAARLAA